MLLTQKTLIAFMAVSTAFSVANAQAPARSGRGSDRGTSRGPAPAPAETEEAKQERERRERQAPPERRGPQQPDRRPNPPERSRPAPQPERPSRPPGRDVDRDGIPDRREPTRQYVEVHYEALNGGVCLEPGYDFSVSPSCNNFRGCLSNDFRAPAEPSDCGSVTESINGDSKTIPLASEKSVSATFTSVKIETEKVCTLVQLPETDCRDTNRNLVPAAGSAYIQYVDSDGNVLSRDRDTFAKNVWGYDVLRVTPQDWQFSYPQQELGRTSTSVKINVLPIDFPQPYTFSASVSQKSDSEAQFSFNSKYFSHQARLVSETPGAQVFEVASKIQPIAASNVTTSFNPEDYTVTITDNSVGELAEIDPKNSATYTVTVYANWTKLSDERLGKMAEKIVVNSNGSKTVVVDLKQDFLGNPKSKFVKEKFDGGGKTWEAYVEVSTQRSNKYVSSQPSSLYVVKSAIGKKKVLGKVELGFTKSEKYLPKQK